MATARGPMGGFLGIQLNAIRNPKLELISQKYIYLLGSLFGTTPSLDTIFTLISPCFHESPFVALVFRNPFCPKGNPLGHKQEYPHGHL